LKEGRIAQVTANHSRGSRVWWAVRVVRVGSGSAVASFRSVLPFAHKKGFEPLNACLWLFSGKTYYEASFIKSLRSVLGKVLRQKKISPNNKVQGFFFASNSF
jgi:hypothetical protein